jgi:REP element-mobilizing transposase RayT
MLFSMSQSLSCVLIHIVFSTKNRAPLLDSSVRPSLNGYLATVTRNSGCECFRVGGVADHVHLAVRIARTITTAQLVEELKTSSSKWLKSQSPALTGKIKGQHTYCSIFWGLGIMSPQPSRTGVPHPLRLIPSALPLARVRLSTDSHSASAVIPA